MPLLKVRPDMAMNLLGNMDPRQGLSDEYV